MSDLTESGQQVYNVASIIGECNRLRKEVERMDTLMVHAMIEIKRVKYENAALVERLKSAKRSLAQYAKKRARR